MLIAILRMCSLGNIKVSFYNLQTQQDTKIKLTSIDFSCQVAHGYRSSFMAANPKFIDRSHTEILSLPLFLFLPFQWFQSFVKCLLDSLEQLATEASGCDWVVLTGKGFLTSSDCEGPSGGLVATDRSVQPSVTGRGPAPLEEKVPGSPTATGSSGEAAAREEKNTH